MGTIRVCNDELRTVRDAMRELNRLVERLDQGDIDKVVLTHRNQMRAVVLTLDSFTHMQRQLEDLRAALAHGNQVEIAAS